jgi:hypothetical protein
MRLKITIALAALALGTALASVPAVAQQGVSGYSHRSGVVAIHPYRHHARAGSLYDMVPQQRENAVAPRYGRTMNDGGM